MTLFRNTNLEIREKILENRYRRLSRELKQTRRSARPLLFARLAS